MSETSTAQAIVVGDMPDPKRRSFALRNSLSSVTAGVGSVFQGKEEVMRPDLVDHTSQEAFEKFKEFNTNTNLRAGQRRMWGGLIDRMSGMVMNAAAVGIGVTAVASSGIPIASAVFLCALAATVTSFFYFQQVSTKEQSDKHMDVSDYSIKREAALIAKEIKQALAEDGPESQKSHSHTQEVIIVKEPANENRAPSTQIAASSAESALESRISELSSAKTISA
jgi:hypothetical protein